MSKQWQPKKTTVELRPSRIRRDPVPIGTPTGQDRKAEWLSSEREPWIVVVGVVLFTLAITALSIGIGAVTN